MDDESRLGPEELDALLGPVEAATLQPGPDEPVGPPGRPARAVLARHRVLASLLALVLVVVAAGAVAALVSRPPPAPAAIDAEVLLNPLRQPYGHDSFPDSRPVDSASPDSGGSDSTLTLSLVIRGRGQEAHEIRAVALLGSGLGPFELEQRGREVHAVGAVRCGDLADSYHSPTLALRLVQTDAWGREVATDVPVTGVGLSGLQARIIDACLGAAIRAVSVTGLRASAATSGPAQVVASLRNPTQHTMVVLGGRLSSGWPGPYVVRHLAVQGPQTLAPHTTTDVTLVDRGPTGCPSSPHPVLLRLWLGAKDTQGATYWYSREVSVLLSERFPEVVGPLCR